MSQPHNPSDTSPSTLTTPGTNTVPVFSAIDAVRDYLFRETQRKSIQCTMEEGKVRVTLVPPSRCRLSDVAILPQGVADAQREIASALKRAGFNIDSPGAAEETQAQIETFDGRKNVFFPVTLVNYLLPVEQIERALRASIKDAALNGSGISSNKSSAIHSLPG